MQSMENHIVVQSASKIREVARKALTGHWVQVAIFMALFYLVESGVSQVLDLFFFTTRTLPIQDGTGANVVYTIAYGSNIYQFLIEGPISVGVSMFFLNFFRMKQVSYGTLFEGFGQFGKALLIMIISSIKIFLWGCLLVVPGIIAAIRYSQAYYIMVDHPEYSANQCIEASKTMMAGNKGRYFYLQLTFIGWYLLASVPSGLIASMYQSSGIFSVFVTFITAIPIFFVNAYSKVAETVFYELAADNLVVVEGEEKEKEKENVKEEEKGDTQI
jgi:uncharacterized membrane protein